MTIRARWTLIIEPTNAQVAADAYQAEHGRPAPGMPPQVLGYLWQLHDVVGMRVAASGHEATAEEAEAAAVRRVEALRDADSARAWMEDTRHQRAGRVSMADLAGGDC